MGGHRDDCLRFRARLHCFFQRLVSLIMKQASCHTYILLWNLASHLVCLVAIACEQMLPETPLCSWWNAKICHAFIIVALN